MIRIRQVANLLGYGEPQILKVFKNTLPTKLYWVLFPIEDLRQAVDTAKRTFVGNYRRDRSSSNDRFRSWSRVSTNRDRIRCYICREYDHLARDFPNSREERDLEQLQHMLNMEEQDCRSLSTHSSDEDCRSPLNL